MGAWGKVIPGSWLGWRQGEQRGDPVQPERRWASQVGHCLGPEGEKVFARREEEGVVFQPVEEAAGWKVGIPMEHLEGKTSQELSSPVDAEGKSRSAVQIPFWGGTSCFPAGTCLAAVKWILDRYPGIVQSV